MLENKLKILGIESSCDETSAAVLEGFDVRSHIVYSQMIHARYGGVVPEIASREHEAIIDKVCEEAMTKGKIDYKELDAIAVTYGPGLMGALLVGLNFAKGLAVSLNIPLVAVNHIEGHLYAPFLQFPDLKPPFLCLLVSGGHSMIIDVKGIRDFDIMGSTLDDAAGESFDKVARLLDIGYPGGPLIDKLSEKGNEKSVKFPRALMGKESLDFSFSGLKTAVLNHVKNNPVTSEQQKVDIAASFQEAVVDALVEKVRRAAKKSGHHQIVLAGGVAANQRLRKKMAEMAASHHLALFYPPLEYCTDNAAMIAAAGQLYYERDILADLSIQAVPNLKLS